MHVPYTIFWDNTEVYKVNIWNAPLPSLFSSSGSHSVGIRTANNLVYSLVHLPLIHCFSPNKLSYHEMLWYMIKNSIRITISGQPECFLTRLNKNTGYRLGYDDILIMNFSIFLHWTKSKERREGRKEERRELVFWI